MYIVYIYICIYIYIHICIYIYMVYHCCPESPRTIGFLRAPREVAATARQVPNGDGVLKLFELCGLIAGQPRMRWECWADGDVSTMTCWMVFVGKSHWSGWLGEAHFRNPPNGLWCEYTHHWDWIWWNSDGNTWTVSWDNHEKNHYLDHPTNRNWLANMVRNHSYIYIFT